MPTLTERGRACPHSSPSSSACAADRGSAAPRYATHLEKALVVHVRLDPADPANAGAPRLVGYTRDVSETGLGVILPDIRINGRSVAQPGRALRLVVGIPGGPLEMNSSGVRHVEMEEGGADTGYLVGVQITGMDAAARTRYLKYLASFAVGDV